MVKVVGYCRFSSENQSDGYSIEAQMNAIRDFCEKQNYEILRFYVDEAKSGTTTDGRTSFLNMLDDSKKKEFEHVIVHKLDRFARSRIDSAVCKQVLKENGVTLISVLEPLDNTPESIILESVLEGMNEYYSKNLSREVKKGQKVAVSKGKILGVLPLGLVADKDNKFQIEPEQAKIVKFIFDEFSNGVGIINICNLLKEQGYKTKFGKDFYPQGVRRILHSRLYVGDYVFGENVYPNIIPPIISREQFELCQTKFKKNITPKDKGMKYILTGVLYHSCGSHMVGYMSYKSGKAYYYYKCVKREPRSFVRKKEMEEAVIKCLIDFLSSEQVIKDLTKSINEYISQINKTEDPGKMKKRIAELQLQDSKLLDLYLTGVLQKDLYTSKKEALDTELQNLKNKLSTCLFPTKISAPVLKAAFKHYLNQIKNSPLDSNSMQAIVSTFIKKIVLYENHFEVTFKFGEVTSAYKRDNAPGFPPLVASYEYNSVTLLNLKYQSSKVLLSY